MTLGGTSLVCLYSPSPANFQTTRVTNILTLFTSMVRDVSELLNALATSGSGVIGRGATSLYSSRGHRQNRKRWILDRLD
jgi:hypothetical protein